MSKRITRFVFIDNPTPGGKRYTTMRRAQEYVKRGWAEWTAPDRIRFFETEAREREATAQFFRREAGNQYRLLHNWSGGRRPDRLYRPGEVCS
jgi:hypothetical protein